MHCQWILFSNITYCSFIVMLYPFYDIKLNCIYLCFDSSLMYNYVHGSRCKRIIYEFWCPAKSTFWKCICVRESFLERIVRKTYSMCNPLETVRLMSVKIINKIKNSKEETVIAFKCGERKNIDLIVKKKKNRAFKRILIAFFKWIIRLISTVHVTLYIYIHVHGR